MLKLSTRVLAIGATGSLLAVALARAADLGPTPLMPRPVPPAVSDPAPQHAPAPSGSPVVQFPAPAPAPGAEALRRPDPRPGSPAARARGETADAQPRTPADAPGAAPSAGGAGDRWTKRFATRLSLFLRQRPLDDAFRDVAEIAGLRVRINDRLEDDIVSATRLSGTVREVLDELTRRYNLVWFAERDLVDVARADTATVRTFRIAGVTDAEIRDAIERFGLINVDFALEVDERNGVARIFGPPRLASRLESIIVGLRADTADPPAGPIEVIKFGLRASVATN